MTLLAHSRNRARLRVRDLRTDRPRARSQAASNSARSVPVIQACAPSARISSNSAARRRASRWAAISSSSRSGAWPSRAARQLPGIGEHDGDQQRLLLAGGAIARVGALSRVAHGKIGQMRAERRAAGFGVADARARRSCSRKASAARRHARPAAHRSRRPARDARTETRPASPARGQRAVEPLDGSCARRRDRDAGFRHLGFEPVEPGRIARAVFQQPRALAHRASRSARRCAHGRHRSRAPAGRGIAAVRSRLR